MVNPRLLSSAPTSRGLAFDLIRSQGPISRVELAERTGLTQATMSNVVRQLMVDGLVVEAGRRESTGGKPRTLLSIDPLARFALGVQLGADAVTVVLTDLGGAMVGRLRTHGVYGEAPDAAVARIAAVVADFLGGLGVPAERVAGLGLVTPGPIDLRHGSIHGAPPLEAWAGFPLVSAVTEATGLPVVLDNDATAAAIGEFWGGSVADSAAHCTVYYGAGIGAGIVLDGVVFRGASSNAGELGQVMSRAPGPFLANTTVEKLAGPVGVALRARAAVAAGREAGFALTGLTDPYADFSVVATAAVHGDPLALELIRDSAEHLAAAVVSIANVLDLDSIVLAGPNLAIAGALYLEAVRRRVDEDFFARAAHGVSVELSAYVADAAAVGGAALVLQREITTRSAGAAPSSPSAPASPSSPASPSAPPVPPTPPEAP
ncbi:ROK family transcriptional regulator [Frigoribacterium sp. CFBP 13729]|jgi:predicted NBD/HSP70 family sugar kinase|uniref:ROK family transcriptional regulator n=1 Tax=unclassified Frigoribacterium TaxID=2627005 RepID=UPI00177D126A|nr:MULTISPECIES: ROK family transcriptional regulator [unclassified Frigoribacterium]MBD8583608.1 ROK family transcriptional regulator [Frigoribacterium sp. CFBP 8766]MBD8610386.1 ROK family transcriptional regulator [Frigoribacterium sp. CFBP 13729]